MNADLEAILRAARRGEKAAIDALCTELYPKVERIVHRSLATDLRRKRPWLGALFSTGDVVQEIFLSVTRDLDGIRGQDEEGLLRYIATLTRNRLVDAIRFYEASRRDRRRHEDGAGVVDRASEDGTGPASQAMHAEQIVRFHRALQTFSERDRTLLRERIESRRPFDQLAELLGYASADSARKAFHVAQARLLHRMRVDP